MAAGDVIMADSNSSGAEQHKGKGQNSWLEMSIEIPGFRDDDALSVFPAYAHRDPARGRGAKRQAVYQQEVPLNVLLLSPPLSYPLAPV